MNLLSLLLVALGGALGSVARVLAAWAIPASRLVWGTVLVNIVGSFLVGCLMARIEPMNAGSLRFHSLAVLGFCGGFTTFSSFSWQTFEQMQKGDWSAAIANVTLSVALCLFATWLGWRLGR
jgi:CrcB protein